MSLEERILAYLEFWNENITKKEPVISISNVAMKKLISISNESELKSKYLLHLLLLFFDKHAKNFKGYNSYVSLDYLNYILKNYKDLYSLREVEERITSFMNSDQINISQLNIIKESSTGGVYFLNGNRALKKIEDYSNHLTEITLSLYLHTKSINFIRADKFIINSNQGYLIMERVNTDFLTLLKQILERKLLFDINIVLDAIIIQILSTLCILEKLQINHNDLFMRNIFILFLKDDILLNYSTWSIHNLYFKAGKESPFIVKIGDFGAAQKNEIYDPVKDIYELFKNIHYLYKKHFLVNQILTYYTGYDLNSTDLAEFEEDKNHLELSKMPQIGPTELLQKSFFDRFRKVTESISLTF